jgi:hypothetical protein
VLLFLLGVAAVPLAIVSEVALELTREFPLPSPGLRLLLMLPIGLALVIASVGLLLRQSWARVVGLFAVLFGAAYYGKLLLPVLLRLRWEHPDAADVALQVGLLRGGPLVGFLVALGVLLLPRLRDALVRRRGQRPRS